MSARVSLGLSLKETLSVNPCSVSSEGIAIANFKNK